jgi:hypothetical protein
LSVQSVCGSVFAVGFYNDGPALANDRVRQFMTAETVPEMKNGWARKAGLPRQLLLAHFYGITGLDRNVVAGFADMLVQRYVHYPWSGKLFNALFSV